MWVEEANGTILLYDRERESSTRLVTGFDNHFPVWTPEGDRIAFRSNREGPFNVFWQTVDGSDQAERLGTSEYGQVPYSFSPDGKLLGYMEERPRSGADIFILSLEGDRSPEPYVANAVQRGLAGVLAGRTLYRVPIGRVRRAADLHRDLPKVA